jgi:hypothetical protein
VASRRAAETSGQMQAGTVRSFSILRKVRTESSPCLTDDARTVVLPDGISRSLDGCKGTEFNYLEIFTESSLSIKQKCSL